MVEVARPQRGQARDLPPAAGRRVAPGHGDASNYLRVHLAHVRRKLEPEPGRPRYLLTEPGLGYRFVASAEAGPDGDT